MHKAHSFKLTKVSIHIQTVASNFQKAISHDDFIEHFSIKNHNTKRQTLKLQKYSLKINKEQL